MKSVSSLPRALYGFVLLALFVLAQNTWAAPYLAVNGASHNYLTLNYYIDEPHDSETLYIDFWPNEGNVEQAQVWSNLGRRDYATLDDQDSSSVPGPAPAGNSYFVGFPLTDAGGGKWSAELPINKTGAYRLSARYKVSGDPEWRWVGGLDTAIMVSPKKARDVILYELQVNVINATGDDFASRSTFEDFTNPSKPANLDYFENLGVNTLWIQPIHPIGDHYCINVEGPGSPYSIQNMWEVAPHMSQGNTRESSMAAFTNFAAAAKAKNIDFFFDIIFNHTSWDAEIGRDPDDPTQPAANPTALIKDILPQWYSRYNSTDLPCGEYDYNQSNFQFELPAQNANQIGPAPAERNDFGKWPDVADLFWGTYPSLFEPQIASDAYWDVSQPGADVKRMTEYFAYFGTYWIEKSGGTLGGFRCDYAQGIPPQAWEYIVNKIRQTKWDFIFMAESLDGGNVSKRAGRHMDIINQNWVWQVLENGGNTTGLRGVIDANKTDYGYAGIMRGLINHDQNAPSDKWYSFSRYAVGAAVDGAPQLYQGQELGYVNNWGFSQFRNQFDRWIPHIFRWHNMQTLWNNRDQVLERAYSRVNNARLMNPAFRVHDQWYLDQQNAGPHQQIFSVLKYDRFGWDPAHQNVVLAFVNLTPWNQQQGTFNLGAVQAIYLNPDRQYNLRNLTSDNPNAYVWETPRTGADLSNNGIFINMGNNEAGLVQFFKLEEHGQQGGGGGSISIHSVTTWPVQGSITPDSDLWVDVWTSPIEFGQEVNIAYSNSVSGSWQTAAMNWAENNEGQNRSRWNINLGKFPEDAVIQFAIEAIPAGGGDSVWDNNNGTDYIRTVSEGEEPPPPPPPTGFAITNPPANIVVGNVVSSYNLQGIAEGIVGDVQWTNALTGASGEFAAANPWSLPGLALAVGANEITVSGMTAGGEEGTVTLAQDDAGNYGDWTDGSNQGTGFGPWSLESGGTAGHFIGANGFGFWSHEGGNYSAAARSFNSALSEGQTFHVRMQNGWIWEEGGSVGVALRDSEGDEVWLLYFNGGAEFYAGTPGETDIGWTDGGLDIEFTLTGPTSYSVDVTPVAGGDTRTYTGSFTGAISDFRAWSANNGTDDEFNSNRDFFVNNLQITEEGTGEPQELTDSVIITREAGEETDTNEDGVPDWWYQQYGLDHTTPGRGSMMGPNGYTYQESYLLNLNPDNVTTPSFLMHLNGNGRFSFNAPGGTRRYIVQHTADLGIPFVDLGEGIDIGEDIEINGDPIGFYRIRWLDNGDGGGGGTQPVLPSVSAVPGSSSFTNPAGITVTLGLLGDDIVVATYTLEGGSPTAYTDGTQIAVGVGLDVGESQTLTLYAENGDGDDDERVYTYTRIGVGLAMTHVGGTHHWVSEENQVFINAAGYPEGASVEAYIVYCVNPPCEGNWPLIPMNRILDWENGDWWNMDLGILADGTVVQFAIMMVDGQGAEHWDNNDGQDYTVVIGGGGGGGVGGDGFEPYSTNPTLGTRVPNGSITINGTPGGAWNNANLIALDMANDDPRTLGDNWTMHEAPIDLTHLWASWDDDYLYIAWQYVDVTDVIDPANAGSAGGGKISNNDGILQWIVLDTIPGQGATNDVWGKQNTWAGANKPNYQIYLAGSLWQGYISREVDGEFALDDGEVDYMSIAAAGISVAKGDTYAGGAELWGVGDADDRFNGNAPNRNFLAEGHSTARDSFYEMRIPLAFLNITAAQLEANGIGIMIGAGSESAMDSIPHDEATLDTPGVEVYNSSFEWGDHDIFTAPFARIGK